MVLIAFSLGLILASVKLMPVLLLSVLNFTQVISMTSAKCLLMWKNQRFSMILVDRPPFLDVKVYCIHKEVKLLAKYDTFSKSVVFEDIQGNGYFSGFQGKGLGTLLVNAALQYLQGKLPPESTVSGVMSGAEDPENPDQLELCRHLRLNFWRSFGFIPQPGTWGRQLISASLGSLSVKKSTEITKEFPVYIPLDDFEVVQPAYFTHVDYSFESAPVHQEAC